MIYKYNNIIKYLPAVVSICLSFFAAGCFESSKNETLFSEPLPSYLTINGVIDISDVAVSPALGGVIPIAVGSVKNAVKRSMLDLSVFEISVEDDSYKTTAEKTGTFEIASMTPREQLVLRAESSLNKAFVLEWMAWKKDLLAGVKRIRITIYSTARSFIARTLRDKYGRQIDPEQISDSEITTTVSAIADVLEKHPEKLLNVSALDEIAEVRSAIDSAAAAVNAANGGVFSRDWTILIYQAGDNDLYKIFRNDLEEMKQVGPPAETAVIIQNEDRILGTRRFLLKAGGVSELARKSSVNAASKDVLSDFLSWGHRAFPARNMALIIASHGTGHRPAASVRPALIIDESAAAMMNIADLKAAIESGITTPGGLRTLDFLGLDASLMGTLEVAVELKDVVKILTFSQSDEPPQGWNYKNLFEALNKPSARNDASAFGKAVAESYKKAYESNGYNDCYSGTLSVIDTGNLSEFLILFNSWIEAVRSAPLQFPALRGMRDSLVNNLNESTPSERYVVQAFEYVDYRDLRNLLEHLRDIFPAAITQTDDLLRYMPKVVVSNVRFGNLYGGANGLSISLPGPSEYADYLGFNGKPPYSNLAFSRLTDWDELLSEINNIGYINKVDGRNLKVSLSWNGNADLDLYIGEPDPLMPENQNKIIWYKSSKGIETSNGLFMPDSLLSGVSEESWKAAKTIIPGVYHIAAYGTSGEKTIPIFKISTIATSSQIVGDIISNGARFDAAIVKVSTSSIEIEPILPPASEEDE